MQKNIQYSNISQYTKIREIFPFTINIPKIENQGEDADPLLIEEKNFVALFTFDGLGGAGSAKIFTGETEKSAAFLASRKVRKLSEEYIKLSKKNIHILYNNITNGSYRNFLYAKLKKYNRSLEYRKSGLKSNLAKTLPTTISGIILNPNYPSQLLSIWAGDSRNYILSAEGLQQITKDDLKNYGDALSNLENDSKISNCIQIDKKFFINHRVIEITIDQYICFSTTDGAFDYLKSPMHFEELLLDAINLSTSTDELKEKLMTCLSKIASDDISMAFYFVGYDSFDHLKFDLSERYKELKEEMHLLHLQDEQINKTKKHHTYIESYILQEKKQYKKTRAALWDKYRISYEKLIKGHHE